MSFVIRAFERTDYPAVRALWEASPGVGLNESDSEDAVAAFLVRNPGLSAVAAIESRIVGAVLCGHDGRRGYLHHLAVSMTHRKRGIARALLTHCLQRLGDEGIMKCNIFLYTDNDEGAAFWHHNGWIPRADLAVLQKPLLQSSPGAEWRPMHPLNPES